MNGIQVLNGMRSALRVLAGLTACGVMAAVQAAAQSAPADSKAVPKPTTYETLYLTHLTTVNEMNDVQTDLRNVLPNAKIYGLPYQHAISIKASEDDLALAHKLLSSLDVPKKVYRLTYTITDVDGGKKGDARRISLVVAAGEKGMLKQGTKVPIVTGATEAGMPAQGASSTQVQYIDVGLNIDASIDSAAEGVRLKTKIEQSSVSEEKSGVGMQDPVIRQTSLESVTMLTPGKALVIGAIDVPGGASGNSRREEVEVLAELVK